MMKKRKSLAKKQKGGSTVTTKAQKKSNTTYKKTRPVKDGMGGATTVSKTKGRKTKSVTNAPGPTAKRFYPSVSGKSTITKTKTTKPTSFGNPLSSKKGSTVQKTKTKIVKPARSKRIIKRISKKMK